ncbi:MAG: hypothetical protein KDA61_16240, partial [Planctomycetales bacterium]|nr:hypothetical protein [Planctomycetales bacterium]
MSGRSGLGWWALGAAACCLCGVAAEPGVAAPPLWKQLAPRKKVSADPQGDYQLSEDHGPWLIMATSFDGPEGERDARDLTLELRENFNLPAYTYSHTFKLDDGRPGRGIDEYGAPIKRRYRRGAEVLQHAVLIGDFPSIDDPQAQETLELVKTIRPASLEVTEGETSTQSLAAVRQFYQQVKRQWGQAIKGPMGHAFMVSNPLLPSDYFAPRGVDADIAKMNEGIKHSLLDCKGRYSVRVATFRGRTSLKEAQHMDQIDTRVRAAAESDPLVTAARKAHDLTVALRSRGWEAYE